MKKKTLPEFKNEDAERNFWAAADSTDYVDWSSARRVKLPKLKPSLRTISLRLPVSMIEDLKMHGAVIGCDLFRRGPRLRANTGRMREDMKKEFDFSKAKRGPVIKVPCGKSRITIRLDDDILDWFRQRVDEAGGGTIRA